MKLLSSLVYKGDLNITLIFLMEVKTLKVISSYCYPGKTGISFTGTETKDIATPASRSGNDDYFMFEG